MVKSASKVMVFDASPAFITVKMASLNEPLPELFSVVTVTFAECK